MANKQQELPLFAVDNTADVEPYLFLNHPMAFVPLTCDAKDEHHSAPPSPTAEPKSILKPQTHLQPQHVSFAAAPHLPTEAHAPLMERKHSTASDVSDTFMAPPKPATDFETCSEGFLGGGALRHVTGSHHLRDLAELAELDQQAKARRQSNQKAVRKPKETTTGWNVMSWWPEPLDDRMEREWSEEFYD
ncbi:uncharacterized protein HMPREF1541_01141 [Cyphellophora europaea CBS 101466]|uniref:Uncharacterized protein n=1 Tax=Cyphellophora europaea (strain CBS 101466) TaxID=1220924 RepID=W2SE07_CYPE1|nr:uncharacterized protein HMPREF1541_01141 [Cyphellophora europaea CBS 101466]ETN46951.1 hypothetical protein HMPREF1541_01141 [Cyphellophora europaea CBS 101466]